MDCIFCKIAKGEIPSVKIWENNKFLAFLDIRPKVEGMTVLVSKKHFDSDVFTMPEEEYLDLFKAAKEVARLLKKGLNAERIFLVKEGAEVNHAHLKLYPVKDEEAVLTDVIGPVEEKSPEELEGTAERIREG